MAEQPLWTGTTSQVKNLGIFLLCILVIPIPWAIWRYLQVKCQVYQLTTERLLITTGIFNKSTETLELYRIRDLQVAQPFFERLFGLHNIHLITTDSTTPQIVLEYLPTALGLPDKFRDCIEKCRLQKRVREVDLE